MAFCTNCGTEINRGMKFCTSCGTPILADLQSEKPSSSNKPEEEFTAEGRKIIKGGPKPSQQQSAPKKQVRRKTTAVKSTKQETVEKKGTVKKQADKKPPVKKRVDKKPAQQKTTKQNPVKVQKATKQKSGRFFFRLLILAVIIWGAVKIFNLAGDWSGGSFSSSDNVKMDEYAILLGDGITRSGDRINQLTKNVKPIKTEFRKVDDENTIAEVGNVKVDFGEFNLNEPKDCEVGVYPDKIIDGECKITVYDISLDNQHQFDDYLTISLPYDPGFVEQGKIEDCVAAQYFNDKTNEWEPVIYDIDYKNKQLIVHTDHLSQYGVFTVKNDKKRNAYITSVYISDSYMKRYREGAHIDVLENYYENDRSLGKEALDFGLSFWGKFSGQSGVAINTLTAGGMYSTDFTSKLNDGFKNLGYAASIVQLGYDLCYSDNKTTAINLTKNIMNQLVAEFGTPAINIAFIGVYFFDVALTEFGNAMLAQKYKELFDVYDYYNKTYNPRSLKEWRSLMIKIHQDNPDDPNAAFKEIMEEIEDYAWKFMNKTGIGTKSENTAELNSLAGEAGLKRMAWPSEKDIDGVYGEGKQKIIDKLFPVFVSVNNWRMKKLRAELTKEASKLGRQLNKKIKLTITENLRKGQASKYGDCTVAIRPLDSGTDKKQWTGMLNKSGTTHTYFTYIGHYTAGMPNRVDIYKPGDKPDVSKPIFTEEFVVDEKNEIIIELGNLAESKWVLFDTEVIKSSGYYSFVKHESTIDNGSLKATCVSPDPASNSFSHYTMSAKWTPFKNSYMEGEQVRTKATVSFDGKNVTNSVLFILFQTALNDEKPSDFKGRSKRAGIDGELTYSDGRETDNGEFTTVAPRALSKDDVWVLSVYGESREYKMYYKPQKVN
ncbi:zinc-ribbon domain-containing protein [Sunxiuqinia sp. A32]|uniref:zinc-ribbon domain-containing protein n=1 Tax=Sunxiuqinia sp. A32 TaxID=3461496 RepID=UPI004045DB57